MNKSNPLLIWLERSLQLPGVSAAVTGDQEGNCTGRSNTTRFASDAVEHALRCAADAFAVLRFQQLPCEWLRWEFEQASFYCACNQQHACLGVFLTQDGAGADPAALERLMDEFSRSPGVK